MPFRLSLFFEDALGRGKVRTFQQQGTVISADLQPGNFSAADRCELMATCGHEVSDRSGRRCAHCKKCLHRDIAIEGSRAICHDCKRTFIGW